MKLTIRKRKLGTIPLLEVVQQDRRTERVPLIVYYHGWQSSKELVLTQGRKLAHAGFRVLLPDALNHGDRKQEMTKIPSLTFWQSIHTNLFEFGYIIEHFRKRGLVDERIYVGGVSMGGITTCALLTHHPEIKAAACVMGSPKPVAYRERIFTHATELGRYVPEDARSLLSWIPQYDLSLNPDKLNGRPLLFWHGNEDIVVPYEDVAQFVRENPLPQITFIEEDEAHLVKVGTMDQIAEFFKMQIEK